jgi:autophagy-related protein 16
MVRFWDAKTGECVHEISDAHAGQVTSVQYSTDGQYVLSASRDNTLKIIDVRTYEVLKTFSYFYKFF